MVAGRDLINPITMVVRRKVADHDVPVDCKSNLCTDTVSYLHHRRQKEHPEFVRPHEQVVVRLSDYVGLDKPVEEVTERQEGIEGNVARLQDERGYSFLKIAALGRKGREDERPLRRETERRVKGLHHGECSA